MFALGWNFTVWFSSPFSLTPWLCVCPLTCCFQTFYYVTVRQIGWSCWFNRRVCLGVGSFEVWEWPGVGFCLFSYFFLFLEMVSTSFWLVFRSFLLWSCINAVLLHLKQMRVWDWLELKHEQDHLLRGVYSLILFSSK